MRTRLNLLWACCLLIFYTTASAQIKQSALPVAGPALNIYGDVGGPGGIISVNYDRRFTGEKGFGFRAGLGTILLSKPVSDILTETKPHLTFPLELNYLMGKEGNYFELGAGMTFLGNMSSNPAVTEKDESTPATAPDRPDDMIWHATLGYRYQPLKRGFTSRVFLSPVKTPNSSLFLYGGVSFGIRI